MKLLLDLTIFWIVCLSSSHAFVLDAIGHQSFSDRRTKALHAYNHPENDKLDKIASVNQAPLGLVNRALYESGNQAFFGSGSVNQAFSDTNKIMGVGDGNDKKNRLNDVQSVLSNYESITDNTDDVTENVRFEDRNRDENNRIQRFNIRPQTGLNPLTDRKANTIGKTIKSIDNSHVKPSGIVNPYTKSVDLHKNRRKRSLETNLNLSSDFNPTKRDRRGGIRHSSVVDRMAYGFGKRNSESSPIGLLYGIAGRGDNQLAELRNLLQSNADETKESDNIANEADAILKLYKAFRERVQSKEDPLKNGYHMVDGDDDAIRMLYHELLDNLRGDWHGETMVEDPFDAPLFQ